MNDVIGKTCPYCLTPIKPGEQVVFCSACSIPHHLECWNEGMGCTTFGCNGHSAAEPSNWYRRDNVLVVDIDTNESDSTQNDPGETNPTNVTHRLDLVPILALVSVFLLLIFIVIPWLNNGGSDNIDTAQYTGGEESIDGKTYEVLKDEQEEETKNPLENVTDDKTSNPMENNPDSVDLIEKQMQTDFEKAKDRDYAETSKKEENPHLTDSDKEPIQSNFEKTYATVVWLHSLLR